MISTKGRYALRVMINLALHSNSGYTPLKVIAKEEEISIKYLEQVISLLNKNGLVQGLRGNSGGYKLTKKPSEYTAGEILRASEGNLACVYCLSCPINNCSHLKNCSTIGFWEGLDEVINKYVNETSLEELTNKYKEKKGGISNE